MMTLFKKFFATGLIILLILSFALWGIGDIFRTQSTENVATVGDETISLAMYQRALDNERDRFRQMLGDKYSDELLKSLGLQEQVLENLISAEVYRQEVERLNMVMDTTTLQDMILKDPTFTNSRGEFDKKLFEKLLRDNNLSEREFLRIIGEGVLADRIKAAVILNAGISPALTDYLYHLNYSQRTVRYVTLDAADVGEVPTPDDKTLEAFYEKVAENYAAPEYRTVEYAVIRQQDVLRNVDINEDDVKILYQQNKDNYLQPERREVEQLIFPDKKQAKEARDAIEGGMELAEAASSFGARNQDSIRLGRVKKEDVFEAAQEKIFSLAEGEVSDTIETAFGWHLFRVTKIIPAGYAPLEEVRERIEADLRQQRADEQMYEITTKIEDNLAGGASLKEIAEQNGLKIKISEPFTASGKKENGESVSGIVSQPQFLTKAFELKEGETSPLLRAGSDQHYLLSVQKITPKRIKALDEVRGLVVSAWQAQEAKKQLKQKAEQSVQQLNQGGTLENVSESLQKPVITSDLFSLKDKPVNLPEMLTESAFHQPVGSTLPLAEQGGIYYLAVVNEEKKAPSEKEDSKFYQEKIKAMEDSLQASYREELLQSYYHHLKMIHPVSINADVLKKALN